MAQDGLWLSGAFPFPVATGLYAPSDSTEKKWDLFFIGRSSVHREQHFGPLKHRYHFLHIAHGIWSTPLIDYIHNASICLNIHAEPEISWEPRLQMLIASGAFVISEKITPNPLLRPNRDFIEITSPQHLHEAVDHYLAHPEERHAIAVSGRQRVQETLETRIEFPKLLTSIKTGQVSRFRVGGERTYLNILQTIVERKKRVTAVLTDFHHKLSFAKRS